MNNIKKAAAAWKAEVTEYGRRYLANGLVGWLKAAEQGDKLGRKMSKDFFRMLKSEKESYDTGCSLKAGTETGTKGFSSWGVKAPEAKVEGNERGLPWQVAEITLKHGVVFDYLLEGEKNLWAGRVLDKDGAEIPGTRCKHRDLATVATYSLGMWFVKAVKEHFKGKGAT